MGEIVSACYIDMNGFCSHVDSSDRLDLYPCQRKLRQGTSFPARQDAVFPKVIPKGQRMIWGGQKSQTGIWLTLIGICFDKKQDLWGTIL